MTTKIQAATLWANGYRLVNKTQTEHFDLISVERNSFDCRFKGIYQRIFWNEIGSKYFILARPLESLTKEITHEGKKFIPVEKLMKQNLEWVDNADSDLNIEITGPFRQLQINANWKHVAYEERLRSATLFVRTERVHLNEYWINNMLHSWHFNIGFPQQWVKPLKD